MGTPDFTFPQKMSKFRLCREDASFSEETSGQEVSDFSEHKEKDLDEISISSDITDPSEVVEKHFHRSRYRKKVHNFLESKPFRIFIIVLICLDVIAVSLELAIASDAFGEVESERPCPTTPGGPRGEPTVNHDLEHGEEFLHWFSISLLIIFVMENLALLWALGRHFFTFIHLFDFSVVLVSLILELALGDENAYAGLLVLLRLIRIVQGVVAAEQEAHIHTQSRLRHSLNHNKHLRRLFKSILLSIPEKQLDANTLYLAKHLLHNSKRFEHKTASYLAKNSIKVPKDLQDSLTSYSEDKKVFQAIEKGHKDTSRHRSKSKSKNPSSSASSISSSSSFATASTATSSS